MKELVPIKPSHLEDAHSDLVLVNVKIERESLGLFKFGAKSIDLRDPFTNIQKRKKKAPQNPKALFGDKWVIRTVICCK